MKSKSAFENAGHACRIAPFSWEYRKNFGYIAQKIKRVMLEYREKRIIKMTVGREQPQEFEFKHLN